LLHKPLAAIFVFILTTICFSNIFAETTNEATVSGPPRLEELTDISTASPHENIIFDNYDEVYIKNFEKEKISEIHFIGNVQIRFQNNLLKARKVVITVKDDKVLEIAAFDRVEMHYEKDIYLADEIIFDPNKERGVLINMRSYLQDMGAGPMGSTVGWYYSAKRATIMSANRFIFEDAVFTTSDRKYPPYSFSAKRGWLIRDTLMFASSVTYTVAQADFLWIPFFFRWERGTGIRTAFGQEKRIGWYMMNSFGTKTSYGQYDFGLDFYERLGEYFLMNYRSSKAMGPIKNLSVNLQAANDIRIIRNQATDRYYQLIDPMRDGNFRIIRQFSWQYRINSTIGTDAYNISIYWENLNDPFLQGKYTTRKSDFDLKEVIQPEETSFYNYGGDASAPTRSFSRGFDLRAGNFSMNGRWNYIQNVVPEVTNTYLNERYEYIVDRVSLPNMSYNLGRLDLFKNVKYNVPISRKLEIDGTNYIIGVNEDIAPYLEKHLKAPEKTKAKIPTEFTNETSTNTNLISTNRIDEPKKTRPKVAEKTEPSYKMTTNSFSFYDFSSHVTANFNYTSTESLETNGDPKSDQYEHTERGTWVIAGSILNGLFGLNNTMTLVNRKKWSSFEAEKLSHENYSGAELSTASTATFNKTGTLLKDHPLEIKFPLNAQHFFNYQIIRTTYTTTPREMKHNSTLTTGFNMFKNDLNFSISANHNLTIQVTNDFEELERLNTNYIDNRSYQRLGVKTSLKLFFVTASTGVTFDILETIDKPMEWTIEELTNRIVGGNPRLTVKFDPMTYIEKFVNINLPTLSGTYVYDILQNTNVSFNLNAGYTVRSVSLPILYELSELRVSANYRHDYLSPKSSYFNMTFATTIMFSKYWKLTFSTSVRNNNLYRYYPENAERFNEPYIPFWENLFDSVNIFDYEALKRGLFKVQTLNFDLVHFLDDWQMHLKFNINRRLDSARRIAYWEPEIRVEFVLSGTSEQFPPYTKKFVPEEYQ